MDVESLQIQGKCNECGQGVCKDEDCRLDGKKLCPNCYWFKMDGMVK